LHWKLEPDSGELKEITGVGLLVGLVGPAVIVVSGGVVSIVKLREAGLGSALLARSMART
jgi:hypothetical protein